MAYYTGETNILTTAKTSSYFDANNTSQGDWGVLDKGASRYYAIAKPGGDPGALEFITPLVYQVTWITALEVWARYIDDGTSFSALSGVVNDLIAKFQNNRTLSGAASISTIVSITAPSYRWSESGPSWIVQEINIRWLEQIQATYP